MSSLNFRVPIKSMCFFVSICGYTIMFIAVFIRYYGVIAKSGFHLIRIFKPHKDLKNAENREKCANK